MDSCYVDVTVEFLAVAFHNILYYTSVYPRSIFETRRKYGIVVYQSTHPEVNQYIDLCLKSIAECLKCGQLNRIEFAVTDNAFKAIMRFAFDIQKNENFGDNVDSYLIQCERNLRGYCLHLSSVCHKFVQLPEDCSFSICMHTNETCAVALETNPDLESFPLVEVHSEIKEVDKIIPLRRFSVRSFNIDTYIEL